MRSTRKIVVAPAVVATAILMGLGAFEFSIPMPNSVARGAGDVATDDAATGDAAAGAAAATSVAEARARARILHETIHGALQVVHRDFFREDEGLTIPSRSLEDVFRELERSQHVQVRWLAVNAEAMHVDHKPQDAFEHDAVKALADGRPEFDRAEQSSYRFAGAIRLASECLKCHVPSRTSNEDRIAGLVITMPLHVQ